MKLTGYEVPGAVGYKIRVCKPYEGDTPSIGELPELECIVDTEIPGELIWFEIPSHWEGHRVQVEAVVECRVLSDLSEPIPVPEPGGAFLIVGLLALALFRRLRR